MTILTNNKGKLSLTVLLSQQFNDLCVKILLCIFCDDDNKSLMSGKYKIHTCPSSGGVRSVHKCPRFQWVGGRGTGDKKRQKIVF